MPRIQSTSVRLGVPTSTRSRLAFHPRGAGVVVLEQLTVPVLGPGNPQPHSFLFFVSFYINIEAMQLCVRHSR